MEEVIIPGPLCCRMTGELMNEPGLIETGDCYERIVIENWINSGKKYDPISKEELKIMGDRGKTWLIENRTFDKLAKEYLSLINLL